MVALDTQLPNAGVGYSPTQWLRWTLSYPIHETDRRARSSVWQNTHPLQAASQLHILCWSTSNNMAILWRSSYRITGGEQRWRSSGRREWWQLPTLYESDRRRYGLCISAGQCRWRESSIASATALSGSHPQWTQIMLVSSSYKTFAVVRHVIDLAVNRSCISRSRSSDNRADPAVVHRFLHRFHRQQPTGVHPSS